MVSKENKKAIIEYLLNDKTIAEEAISEVLELDEDIDINITGIDELAEQIDIDIELNACFKIKPKTEE